MSTEAGTKAMPSTETSIVVASAGAAEVAPRCAAVEFMTANPITATSARIMMSHAVHFFVSGA